MTEPEALSTAPDPATLADAIRRHLGLRDKDRVSLEEVGELSNINYVYRVDTTERGRSISRPFPSARNGCRSRLPRERVFSEAEGLRTFGALAGADLVMPEVLFVDGEEMALAMSDVGDGTRDPLQCASLQPRTC